MVSSQRAAEVRAQCTLQLCLCLADTRSHVHTFTRSHVHTFKRSLPTMDCPWTSKSPMGAQGFESRVSTATATLCELVEQPLRAFTQRLLRTSRAWLLQSRFLRAHLYHRLPKGGSEKGDPENKVTLK